MSLDGFLDVIGCSRHTVNDSEKVISAVGGFLGIFGILSSSQWLLDPDIAVIIVLSMGASAVLLFAAPHAQPWGVREQVVTREIQGYAPIKHEDFVYALSHIDTFVNISEEDLLAIYELATRRRVESS